MRERFQRIAGSIHVHTSFSGAKLAPEEVVALAKKSGLKVLAITDYSDRKWEYHRITMNRASVLKFGVREYVEKIASITAPSDDMIIICGLEASPFYYWEGNFLKPVCRDYNKHLLVLGLKEIHEYENLPLLANRNSGYDQYSGSQGIRPYQRLIDYVNNKRGLTFWAHPEMEDDFRYLNARLYTPPYAEDLKKSSDYTGFSVFPRGSRMVPEPGGCWDEVLCDYCSGKRGKPVWCIAETDYRRVEDDIANPATVFVNSVSNEEDAISALREGKVYALDSPQKDLFLNYFGVWDEKRRRSVSMGGELQSVSSSVTIKADVESKHPLKNTILIKDGVVIKESDEKQFEFVDDLSSAGGKVFYRLIAENVQGSRLFSNPVFVNP